MTVGLDPTGIASHPDEFHRGQSWKRYCRVATTANITLSGTQTIDGVACVAGDRVLVKNQTTGSQNGIWIVAAGAWSRDFDMDQDTTYVTPAEEVLGAVVHVIAGTANGGTLWRCTNTTAPVLGTTALTFAQVASATPGTVTSVALTVPAELSVTGSPVTSSGTLAVTKATQSANAVWAGPTSGAAATPAFRALVAADIPTTGGAIHEILISDTPSTPLIFADLIQNEAQTDLVYAD